MEKGQTFTSVEEFEGQLSRVLCMVAKELLLRNYRSISAFCYVHIVSGQFFGEILRWLMRPLWESQTGGAGRGWLVR